jgi:predicted nucleotidyltransferase
MSLLRLNPKANSLFDPLEFAQQEIVKLGLDSVASSIYIFGSAINGNFTAESDIDILVVLEDQKSIREVQALIVRLGQKEWPIDWILKEKSDFERRSEIGGVCFIAKAQGRRLK